MNKQDLWKRLEFYISETGIDMVTRNRYREWKTIHLPDLRGFTPHLRRVNLYQDQEITSENWIIHDLLHILFYDFAALHLGDEAWTLPERFLENHLASEAFAVLALDYHILSREKGEETLTIDLNANDWSAFQHYKEDLPQLLSFDWCQMLVKHYLTGEMSVPKLQGIRDPIAQKFETWIGHEVRYARKQRAYVRLWLDDLMCMQPSNEAVEVHDSAVDSAVWELVEILLQSKEADFKKYVSKVKKAAKRNAFKHFRKYKKQDPKIDYRFTDTDSQTPDKLLKHLNSISEPSGSDLFFLWQLIQSQPFKVFTDIERSLIEKVARDSQKNSINNSEWLSLIEKVKRKKITSTQEKDLVAAFLLS